MISQRLVKAAEGGRVPAVEVLLNTTFVAELIEQGRLSEIKDAMEKSLAPGSQTFERALVELVRARRVSKEEALAASDSPTNLLWLLENSEDTATAPAPARPSAAAAGPAGAQPAPVGDSRADAGKPAPQGPSYSEFLLNI
ncbi:MAG TPA: hypothetical protein VM491_18375 [Burkholderiaceae bacterium]|nr:hypothetical protein [Burkholderiaceae bacterium]